ncbi:MAG: AAA family ATPase [Planctomycetota bacterium]|nr:AAA family ATPase [Planctomycetota bacterium]
MSRPQIIASTGGKGGAGKTVFSILFCRELARMGKKVALIDADLGTPNVHTKLGLKSKGQKRTLQRALAQPEKLKSALIEVESIGTRSVEGGRFSVLSSLGDSNLRSFGNWDDQGQQQFYNQFKAILDQFSQLDRSSSYDVVVLDTRAGIDGNVCDFCMMADDRVVITGEEDTLRADAVSLLKMLHFYDLDEDKHNPDRVTANWIVANKAEDEGMAQSVCKSLVNDLERWASIRKDISEIVTSRLPRYLGWIPEIEIPGDQGTLLEARDAIAEASIRQLVKDLCCMNGDDPRQQFLSDLTR